VSLPEESPHRLHFIMADKRTDPPAENFEKALAELEAIVAAMENADLPLEQALSNYQRGVALLRQCQATLNAADARIRLLEDGQLVDLPTERKQ
jgi:exodeoxyribonuclease VII small subunit